MKIKSLGLSNRVYNALMNNNIDTVEKLTMYTPEEIRSLHLIGSGGVKEITTVLESHSLSLSKGRNDTITLETPIEALSSRNDELYLRRPAMHVLRRGGINTVKELLDAKTLMSLKHMGPVKAAEIEEVRERLREMEL